jgi:hypothetical protein
MLRRIFGSRRDEVTAEWRKLHNEELNDLYCSPNIVQVIKLRRIRWAGHVALMGVEKVYSRFWWGNLRERDHLVDSDVEGRTILRWIFRKWDMGVWTGSSWLMVETVLIYRYGYSVLFHCFLRFDYLYVIVASDYYFYSCVFE